MSTLTLSVRPDLGLLLLRAALAGMWLSHGLLLKLFTYGAPGLSAWLVATGLPGGLAWPLILAESLGGLLILLGLLGTFWGLLSTINAVTSAITGLNITSSDPARLFDDLPSEAQG